jgi:hypothetical protein
MQLHRAELQDFDGFAADTVAPLTKEDRAQALILLSSSARW